jgi:hypothetical protein
VLNIYTLSSWECWWYSVTYSQRPLVEMYQLLALPLACTVAWALTSRLKSVIVFSALTLLCTLNIFQIWQFMQGIIDGERMTKTYYWRVFLKTTATDEDRQYLEVSYTNDWPEYFNDKKNNYTRKEVLNLNFEKATDKNITDTIGYESNKCLMLNSEFAFSPSYSQEYKNISEKKHIWVRATAKVFPITDPKESNASLVLSFNSKGRMYKYKATDIYESGFKPGQWNTITVDYMSPYVRHGYDKLDIYFWNMGSGIILIDDFKAEIFEPIVEY